MPNLNNELEKLLISEGASLVGFADLREMDEESRDGFPFGISIAVRLNRRILSEIAGGPTRLYYDEYQRLNRLLENLGQSAERLILGRGYDAVSLPVKSGESPDNLSTRLPHKTVATRAGLGWVGKCALLVTEKFGSAVRLTTVLTDAPLSAGKPIDTSQCGDCTECVDLCPAHALSGKSWQAGASRESLCDTFACRDTARRLSLKNFGMEITLCGRCIVACPWTQKYLSSTN